MPIGPCCFNGDPPQVRVPGLGDPAPSGPRAARVLARAHPAIAHQLRRSREARQLADFRDDRHRRDQCDPAQRLEGVDHRPHRWRRRRHRLIDRPFEPFDAADHVIDFVQVVQPRGLLRRLLELHLTDPRQVSLCPRRHRGWRPPSVPQQKFAETMAGAQLVLLRRLSSSHQIPQRFVRGVRHPHGRQVSGAVTPRELLGIASIRLHPIAGLGRRTPGARCPPPASDENQPADSTPVGSSGGYSRNPYTVCVTTAQPRDVIARGVRRCHAHAESCCRSRSTRDTAHA